MAPIESLNRIALNYSNRSYSCAIGSDIETEDSVSHFYYYQNLDAIARFSSDLVLQ